MLLKSFWCLMLNTMHILHSGLGYTALSKKELFFTHNYSYLDKLESFVLYLAPEFKFLIIYNGACS